METRPSKASRVVLVLVMLAVFGSGVFLGMTLAPRVALAATPQAAGGRMAMQAGGGCPMMGGGKSGGCSMMSGGKPGDKAAPATAGGMSGMGKSGGCSMMSGGKSGGCSMGQGKTDAKPASGSAPPTGDKASPAGVIYTCPMHPDVQSKTPGQCPKCGMNLVKKT